MNRSMREELKRIFLAGLGAVSATSEKSRQLVDELVKQGELTLEEGKTLNEELKHKKKEEGSAPFSADSADVRKIKEAIGKMSPEDLAEIRAKVAEIDGTDGKPSQKHAGA